jgi:hypothetical protein
MISTENKMVGRTKKIVLSVLTGGEAQRHDESSPAALEPGHVIYLEDFLKRLVSGGVVFHLGDELVIKRPQQFLLLQVVAEVAGLGIVAAGVIFVERAVGGRA